MLQNCKLTSIFKEILEMSTDEESDCMVISPSNGHAINSSQCDNSPRHGQEETSENEEAPEREETENRREPKARSHLQMSHMASDTKEEKSVSTRVKKLISSSKSMGRTGTSALVEDSGKGTQKSHTVPLPLALATDKRVTGKPSQSSVSPVGSRNGERVLEKSSSHKIQVWYFHFLSILFPSFFFSLEVVLKVLFVAFGLYDLTTCCSKDSHCGSMPGRILGFDPHQNHSDKNFFFF
jgi:hypothetical protein